MSGWGMEEEEEEDQEEFVLSRSIGYGVLVVQR